MECIVFLKQYAQVTLKSYQFLELYDTPVSINCYIRIEM